MQDKGKKAAIAMIACTLTLLAAAVYALMWLSTQTS